MIVSTPVFRNLYLWGSMPKISPLQSLSAVRSFFSILILTYGCNTSNRDHPSDDSTPTSTDHGWVIAIGGGKRTDTLMAHIVHYCGLNLGDTVWIAPMASEEPDSAYWYVARDFERIGLVPVPYIFYSQDEYYPAHPDRVKLIFFTGGDQTKLMKSLKHDQVLSDLVEYRKSGGHIAGTSAGAAVLSQYMITGNQLKFKDYRPTFAHLMTDNIEIASGTGLLKNCIIDQHFIARSRYNRLISALYQMPNLCGIGVEESSAILTDDSLAIVIGSGQIVKMKSGIPRSKNDLIGFQNLSMDILLPGDTFFLK